MRCCDATCDREATVRGYCKRCYYRARSRGELSRLPLRNSPLPQANGEDKLRRVWRAMHKRCSDPRVDRYPRYGGRGIHVCSEWSKYEPFRDWAVAHGYADRLTIDRIDTDGGYEPSNCRWILPAAQLRNMSRNRWLIASGVRKTVADWADDPRCRVSYVALIQRIERGWPADRALTEPAHRPFAERAHCPAGHPYDEANTGWTPRGHRTCRACRRARARDAYARKTRV